MDVISQDNTANRITYEYVDENGNTRTGGSTISEFESAIQQASQYQPAPEAPVVEEPAPEEPQQQVVEEEPTPQAPEEIPVTPETIDWDALFEQDPEAYFIELQNQFI